MNLFSIAVGVVGGVILAAAVPKVYSWGVKVFRQAKYKVARL